MTVNLAGVTLEDVISHVKPQDVATLLQVLLDSKIISDSQLGNVRNSLYKHKHNLGGMSGIPREAIRQFLLGGTRLTDFHRNLTKCDSLVAYVPNSCSYFLNLLDENKSAIALAKEALFIVTPIVNSIQSVKKRYPNWSCSAHNTNFAHPLDFVILIADDRPLGYYLELKSSGYEPSPMDPFASSHWYDETWGSVWPSLDFRALDAESTPPLGL